MKPPLVFVSYSHDSRDHQEWVRAVFVDGLRSRAVDARMDAYELSYGDKIDAFMEMFVASCDHIAAVCTPNYADRAARDVGGVGYEKQLIRRFITDASPEHKVIPILRAGGEAAVPAYMGARLYVDMQSDEHIEELLDQLATVLYGAQVVGVQSVGVRAGFP
jgi:hypothetical protein